MPMTTMLDAMTSPANSNPVATTEVECASKPMMILLQARMPLTPMPATATRRAVRYDSSTIVNSRNLLLEAGGRTPGSQGVLSDLRGLLVARSLQACGDD